MDRTGSNLSSLTACFLLSACSPSFRTPSLTRFPSYLHPLTFYLLPGNPPTGSRPDGRDRQGKFSESSLGKITGTIARLVVLDDCRFLQPAHFIGFLPIQVFTCQICNISPKPRRLSSPFPTSFSLASFRDLLADYMDDPSGVVGA